MKIQFLGTNSGAPTKERNVSCITVQFESGQVGLFDCGEGTQHQLQKSTLKGGKINTIFITHLHGDHIFGLPGLLCSISGGNPEDRTIMTVYGPLGIAKFLKESLELSDSHLAFKLIIHELIPANTKKEDLIKYETEWLVSHNVFFDDKNACFKCDKVDITGITVTAAPILHRVYTVGYVLQEETKIGRLDIDKLKQQGIKPGPVFSKIKNKQDVTLEDGTLLKWTDYIGQDIIGRKVVILGDTYDPSGIAQIAQNCDVITHESTLDDDDTLVVEKGHSTPSMAAKFAKSINAKKLILTHYSSRYAPEVKLQGDDRVSISLLRDQAKKIFENVELAEDFKSFDVKKE